MTTQTQIKQYKASTNVSYRELAEILGVGIATVENWASGKHRPNEANQRKLNKLLKQERTANYKPVELPSGDFAIDSRLVAEMVEKNHKELLRDIRQYTEYLNDAKTTERNFAPYSKSRKINVFEYFIENTYKHKRNGLEQPCYLVTKKGCELIAHKMTGQKGVLFTARYIDLFHEMERKLQQPTPPSKTITAPPVASYTPQELDCAYIDKLVDEVKREHTLTEKYLKLEEITLIAQRMEQVRGHGGKK